MNAVKTVTTVNNYVLIILDLTRAIAASAIGWLQMVLLAMVNKTFMLMTLYSKITYYLRYQ